MRHSRIGVVVDTENFPTIRLQALETTCFEACLNDFCRETTVCFRLLLIHKRLMFLRLSTEKSLEATSSWHQAERIVSLSQFLPEAQNGKI